MKAVFSCMQVFLVLSQNQARSSREVHRVDSKRTVPFHRCFVHRTVLS